MNILTDIIPAAWRKAVYAVYALAGVTLGAIDVALDPNPAWLTTTFAVYAFLGTALGLVAASNVATPPGDEPDVSTETAPYTQPH